MSKHSVSVFKQSLKIANHVFISSELWNHSNQLSYFQERLEQLATNESSSLHSFKSFCQNGASPQERLTLLSIRRWIEMNVLNLSEIISQYADG